MGRKKSFRILWIYGCLEQGKCINIHQVSQEFGVDLRTIQRDIADIKDFLSDKRVLTGEDKEIIYDRNAQGYKIAI